MIMAMAVVGWMAGLAASGPVNPPAGIPKELAVERAARVSEVEYDLSYVLIPHAGTTAATETMRFQLTNAAKPLLVDFRDGAISSLTLNGTSLPANIANGHLVLPAGPLKVGANVLEARFTANVAASEKSLTRFEDKDDGNEYIYSLFVPMDADMAFPCFDQPDLKGRFQLSLGAPSKWTVISNTRVETVQASGNETRTTFARTEPISTYLFAFAAGPFKKVHAVDGLPGLYVRASKAQAAESEALAVQQTAAAGIEYLSGYFNQPFPFPKYDMVLIPGFAFGGMEHAGATFLREESVLFRTAPTRTNLFNRQVLVLHELTHQWFGDFTTMRWFDDLWLKEGFAQYMAYQTLAALSSQPQTQPQTPGTPADGGAEVVWKRFYEQIKPLAYAIDQTQGTTPIYQDIPNLNDAKSAYGAIVYQKAPAVIKQLAFVLGDEDFRRGLQIYLAAHRYGNATWSDLIQAFQKSSGRPLNSWADDWIRHRGMPRVGVTWSCSGGKISQFEIAQRDTLGTGALWPIATEVGLGDAGQAFEKVPIHFSKARAQVAQAVSKPCPAYVFANAGDQGYGLFLLDPVSRRYVVGHIGEVHDLLERTLLWGSLWASVQNAEMDPREYLDLALNSLPAERDEALTATILTHVDTALDRYVPEPVRTRFAAQFAALASSRMLTDADQDLRIVYFRAVSGFAESPAARETVKGLLRGSVAVPGVTLRQQDRWRLVTTLVQFRDAEADTYLAAEQQRDPSAEARKYAWIAGAAEPDAASKAKYFDQYLHNAARPEDWIEGSLGAFNAWNQAGLTEPYLKPSLDALGQIKRTRKIFFLGDWLGAFIGGQVSPSARDRVFGYLSSQPGLDKDLRLKILQVVDELDRTVKIRARWG
jgi:aminopeptidase N